MDSKQITQALRTLNSEILLVIILGILSSGVIRLLFGSAGYLDVFIFFIIAIVTYGRITSRLESGEAESALSILKNSTVNFIVASIILVTPSLILSFIAKALANDNIFASTVIVALDTTVSMLTVYVLPVVFIKHEHLLAVLSGITYLIKDIRSSWVLLVFVAGLAFAKGAFIWMLSHNIIKISEEHNIIILVATVTMIFTYAKFFIFSVASARICQKN